MKSKMKDRRCICSAPTRRHHIACLTCWDRIPVELRRELQFQRNRCRGSLLHRAAARRCLAWLRNHPVVHGETAGAGLGEPAPVNPATAQLGLRLERSGA